MIEMCLRSFTDLDGKLIPTIKKDGSCHTYSKQFHLTSNQQILEIDPEVQITTPIYPFLHHDLDEILNGYRKIVPSFQQDKKILIHASDQKWAEINLLFQYYKISLGLNLSFEIFAGQTNQQNVRKWNPNYQHWSEMKRWEYREWLSLFYPKYVEKWIYSPNLISDDFLVLSNREIMESLVDSLQKIIKFCGLRITKSSDDFVKEYIQKQQYILEEYSLIDSIIECTINQKELTWQAISIVGESILQQKFRQLGYEWYCNDLNELPTNSIDFKKLIYQPRKI